MDRRARRSQIDATLAEFEARLRRQALRDRLSAVDRETLVHSAFEGGHLPTIDVNLEALANSRPAA